MTEPPREARNVVLITADAWRADLADAFAGVRLTPALDEVAATTVRFDALHANAPWTSPALLSVFTGQPPTRHGVHFEWSVPRPTGQAVVQRLVDAGWHAPNLSYLNRLTNYRNLGYAAGQGPEDADPERLLRAIRATPEPFFLWFHYKDTHLPYWPAERYRRALGIDDARLPERLRRSVCDGFVVPRHLFHLPPRDADLVRRLYAAGVLELNTWLGRVLDAVAARDAAPRTFVVLTSDHGEELLDHGHVGHASTAYHAAVFEELLRVPLFVVGDEAAAGPRRVAERVQGLDLHATLLSLAGAPAPPTTPAAWDVGIDLAPIVRGDAAALARLRAVAHRPFVPVCARMGCRTAPAYAGQFVVGLTDGRAKVVVERYETQRAMLYDLTADPGERRPICAGEALRAGVGRLDRILGPGGGLRLR